MRTALNSKIPAAKLLLYEKLVATIPAIDRKGAVHPYTSHNGHMFTYLDQTGTLGIRLPKEELEADQGYYISLKGYAAPSGQLPQWYLHSQNSVNYNIVWEFCTCSSVATCGQVSGPAQVRLGPATLK